MSASENLGSHLLGRRPSDPDSRDYQLASFLSDDPLDAALTTLMTSRAAQATKAWAKIATARIHALEPAPAPNPGPAPPQPSPTPPVAPTAVVWGDTETVLDQGQTPHCVGFGSAQWGNTLPIDDHFTDADGNAIYYECKVIDGEPKAGAAPTSAQPRRLFATDSGSPPTRSPPRSTKRANGCSSTDRSSWAPTGQTTCSTQTHRAS